MDPSGELASGPLSVAWSAGSAVAAPLTVVLTGSVRNLHAIADQLGAEPGIAPERLLAIAFERWGDGALTRLRGNFVVAVWNETAKKGLVAVDQLGAASLFLHESNGGFAFASEIRNLVRLLTELRDPISAAVVQWLVAGSLQRGQTLLEGSNAWKAASWFGSTTEAGSSRATGLQAIRRRFSSNKRSSPAPCAYTSSEPSVSVSHGREGRASS